MHIEKISGTFGARISDFSLADLDDESFRWVANSLWEHQVLVFKEQHLSTASQVAFGQRFGELHTHPSGLGYQDYPEVLVIKNSGKKENITQVWHSDVCCEERPPSISILQAIQVPASDGDTMWANQYEALDRLSPAMRDMISPLRAVHRGFKMEAVHPVVRTHPETGRKALYVNHGFTKQFEGMTEEESKPLLDFLVQVGSSYDLTLRHNWLAGDVVVWDNRCVTHYAIHDYDESPRQMQRVTVIGEKPQ